MVHNPLSVRLMCLGIQISDALAQELVDSGAALHAPDYVCRTPLHAAADGGHTAAVKLLLARGGSRRINSVTRKGVPNMAILCLHEHCPFPLPSEPKFPHRLAPCPAWPIDNRIRSQAEPLSLLHAQPFPIPGQDVSSISGSRCNSK